MLLETVEGMAQAQAQATLPRRHLKVSSVVQVVNVFRSFKVKSFLNTFTIKRDETFVLV